MLSERRYTAQDLVVPRTVALALTQVSCWASLPHEERRLAYETVCDMERLGTLSVPALHALFDWLGARLERRPGYDAVRHTFGGGGNER